MECQSLRSLLQAVVMWHQSMPKMGMRVICLQQMPVRNNRALLHAKFMQKDRIHLQFCRRIWQHCGMGWTPCWGGRRRQLLRLWPGATPRRCLQCRPPSWWTLASGPTCSMSLRCTQHGRPMPSVLRSPCTANACHRPDFNFHCHALCAPLRTAFCKGSMRVGWAEGQSAPCPL